MTIKKFIKNNHISKIRCDVLNNDSHPVKTRTTILTFPLINLIVVNFGRIRTGRNHTFALPDLPNR